MAGAGQGAGMDPDGPARPLTTLDGVALLVGTVVGVGIFQLPALVAQNAGSQTTFLLVWLAGAVVALLGGLCYAELATRDADSGGEYSFLTRAFGAPTGFLFAWARLAVIQTGSIALVGFIFGDYAQTLFPLGSQGPAIYALVAVAVLTAVNLRGAALGARAQKVLTLLLVASVLVLVLAGLTADGASTPAAAPDPAEAGAAGLALVFVLYTFGGWNEAAYIAGELRDVRRAMVRVLILGILLITALYFALNLAYLRVLGLGGLAASQAVGADLAAATMGETAGTIFAGLVALAALTTMNAAIFTGSRATYAMGRDYPRLPLLGNWTTAGGRSAPSGALMVQAVIAMLLILGGAFARDGLMAMVEYTAPVFWTFLLLVGLSLFVRRRQETAHAPFRVPLYPLTPLLFCAASAYMLYSSLAYTGRGALFGLAALALGLPLLLWARRGARPAPAAGSAAATRAPARAPER